ncbi:MULTISPECIES: Crp/Fnr family transcriptional regulator [Sphingomonas]|uniref:Crp/Fnr family transcriptional regulator n=1 Tax=Sphingomonas TaxID=13687 RepID=UPI0013B42A7D|nr:MULTISPECIES: Crp/Fnr family transcriptional regulator [Sphingomonas]
MASGGDFSVETGATVPDELLDGSQVFIVTEGVASKFQLSPSGKFSEVGMVGCEGMFPVSALLSVPGARHVVLVQVGPLRGRRVRTKDFQRIIADSAEAREVVQRYLYAFITQVSSNLLCAEQSVTSRLARWLLMCQDRLPDDAIEVTHDALAQMTVSHRPTVTNMLKALRAEGLIEMCRGCITIRDREGLIGASEGGYGAAERYWQDYLAPLGKGGSA